MDFTTLFIGLLFAALLYLHIKQSNLIFQHDIKAAKKLAIILLCILTIKFVPNVIIDTKSPPTGSWLFIFFLYHCFVWILSILIFWKILSGCQADAFLRRIGKSEQSLREKIKDLLLDIVEKNRLTTDFKFFIGIRFEDPVIDSVSDECRAIDDRYHWIGTTGPKLSPKDIEKLKELIEQLG